MSDSFRQATGRKVVSRATAQSLGEVGHLLVDSGQRSIVAVIVGRGKKARFVDWDALSGFGPDAVMVGEESALRSAADDREGAGAEGKLDLVGRRVLTEHGNELGEITDVTFDPVSGALEMLQVGNREIPAGAMLGAGSYAVIVDADQEPPPQ